MIVDTSYLSPAEVVKTIIDGYKRFLAQRLSRLNQICAESNCFISKAFIDDEISLPNTVTVSADEILNNAVISIRSRGKDDPNKALYQVNHLTIVDFQNCNGKEAAQRIITDILSSRVQNGLPALLVSNYDFFDIKYISQNLKEVITKDFKFLP